MTDEKKDKEIKPAQADLEGKVGIFEHPAEMGKGGGEQPAEISGHGVLAARNFFLTEERTAKILSDIEKLAGEDSEDDMRPKLKEFAQIINLAIRGETEKANKLLRGSYKAAGEDYLEKGMRGAGLRQNAIVLRKLIDEKIITADEAAEFIKRWGEMNEERTDEISVWEATLRKL